MKAGFCFIPLKALDFRKDQYLHLTCKMIQSKIKLSHGLIYITKTGRMFSNLLIPLKDICAHALYLVFGVFGF